MLMVILVTAVVCFTLYLVQDYLTFQNLPPGVYGLPLFGYLPFLDKNYQHSLAKLAKKYGNIFSVRLGSENVVFLSDWKSIKDAYSNPKILGRPKVLLGGFLNQPGLLTTDGPLWKANRKISLRVLHDVGKEIMEENIRDELNHFLTEIDATVGKPYNIDLLLFLSVFNNIASLIFGHRYEYSNPVGIRMNKIQSKFTENVGMLSTLNFVPLLSKLATFVVFSFRSLADDAIFFHDLLADELRKHEENEREHVYDFMDGCLAVMKNDKNTHLSREVIRACASDVFGSGFDTVSVTLKWLLLFTAINRKIQTKVQEEIDEVIGRERLPTWADHSHMQYTQAVICELYRWAPILPLNLPRRVTEDTSISGHFIPKNTQIIANLWAASRDPTVWKDPESFEPQRFLSEDGKELNKIEALIPFSYGKRSCIGEEVGRREVFLYYVSILQKYYIRIPKECNVTLEATSYFALIPKQPPVYVFTHRV